MAPGIPMSGLPHVAPHIKDEVQMIMKKEIEVSLETLIGDLDMSVAEAVRQNKICPYMKPLRTLHSSGYRQIEVGYCHEEKKHVLASYSDHIWWDEPLVSQIPGYPGSSGPVAAALNMDLDRWGRFRIFRGFVWTLPVLSSATLKYVGLGKDQ